MSLFFGVASWLAAPRRPADADARRRQRRAARGARRPRPRARARADDPRRAAVDAADRHRRRRRRHRRRPPRRRADARRRHRDARRRHRRAVADTAPPADTGTPPVADAGTRPSPTPPRPSSRPRPSIRRPSTRRSSPSSTRRRRAAAQSTRRPSTPPSPPSPVGGARARLRLQVGQEVHRRAARLPAQDLPAEGRQADVAAELRVDVRPSGRPTVKVFSSAKKVRDCAREICRRSTSTRARAAGRSLYT
jgi:hypothetical protein